MDLLQKYGSDNDDSGSDDDAKPKKDVVVSQTVKRPDRNYLQAAPAVSLTASRHGSSSLALVSSSSKGPPSGVQRSKGGELILMNNPTKDVMYQPTYGPNLDDLKRPQGISGKTAGAMEANVAFDHEHFKEQRAAFQRSGRAVAPTDDGQQVLRTTLGYSAQRLEAFAAKEEKQKTSSSKRPRPDEGLSRRAKKKDGKEPLVYGSDDEVEFGIWAPPSKEERWAAENSLSDIAKGGVEALAPEQLAEREYIKERNRQKGLEDEAKEEESAFDRLVERKMAHLLPPKIGDDDEPMEASTTFHGDQQVDYKGRSWIAPPAGLGNLTADMTSGDHMNNQAAASLDMDHHRCYVPKKCVHRFTGHNKGVHRIRLFPRTGHLLLSGGLDGKCKVWSIEQKQVMRTYVGHSAAVRDVQFNHDGTKFVSASFDRYLRLWETESGKVLQTFTNKKVPYCVKFYPLDDNLFVVGCSDNKIVTYDATTGEVTQEYNHHLAPVNAIVFVEDQGNMKMVSSSDDKKVLVWEWDIGVPVKYISDPTMHSMPCLVMHPSHNYFVGQSLDNTIAVFQAGNRFALQRKKKFSGHVVSGYACEMAFSPDGQFLVSGDGNGSIFFWDWKKHKILQKYRAHTGGPAICCVWHPLEPTVMFTCGWDGVIKMWQ